MKRYISIPATKVKNDKIRFGCYRQSDKAVISTRILYKKRIIRKGLILADMACFCMNSYKTGKSGEKLFFRIMHECD